MRHLSSVLLLGLFAMALPAAASASATLRVGAARLDVTPPADPAKPPSGKYEHERLYVRAIVLDNGSARAVLVAVFAQGASGHQNPLRTARF